MKRHETAQTPLVIALAHGASVEAAAKAAGLSRATVYRRLGDPDFRKQVDDARAEIVRRATGRLSSASVEAAETLRRLLYSEQPFARLAAARAILEIGAKFRSEQVVEARLTEIEEALANGGKGWKSRAV